MFSCGSTSRLKNPTANDMSQAFCLHWDMKTLKSSFWRHWVIEPTSATGHKVTSRRGTTHIPLWKTPAFNDPPLRRIHTPPKEFKISFPTASFSLYDKWHPSFRRCQTAQRGIVLIYDSQEQEINSPFLYCCVSCQVGWTWTVSVLRLKAQLKNWGTD